ncbi:hypothetical protein [Paenibacillus odorifer]|uniref:hypothetical protein n=1 Tax=Paenibacillus odorifer TaxID=189426 RepID=UPI00096DB8F1|nr:hypothetical protein [Paenibacillus odorifer]OMD76858.1 hypothetical protein BSK50_13985 [Paenibacillus odorifer]
MNNEKHAVLQWNNNDKEEARVVLENIDLDMAQTMVKITPFNLGRGIITMSTLESIRNDSKE